MIPASFTTLRHFGEIAGDKAAEIAGRAADGDKALRRQLLDDLGRAQDLVEDGVVSGNGLGARVPAGASIAEPEIDVDARNALLGKRGHVGRDAHALLVGHREHPDLVVLRQRQADVDGDEHRADMAADQVLHGGGRAAVGHVLASVPVASLNSSMERWCGVPRPGEA